MNKGLETLEKLMSFAFVMSENMVGLSKGNYDENQFIKKTYEYLHKYSVDAKSQVELKKSLQRLEAIDNAEPSKALEILNLMGGFMLPTADGNKYLKDFCDEEFDIIRQALLKAQEQEMKKKIKDLTPVMED